MPLEGIVEVLGGRITQFVGDFSGRFVGIEQVAAGQQEALGGEVAEDGGLEGLFEAAFELEFIQAYFFRYFGEIGRAGNPFIDEIAGGDNLFLRFHSAPVF